MKTKIFFLTLLLTSLCTYNAHAYDIIIGGIKYNYANTAGDGLEWYKVDNSSNGTLIVSAGNNFTGDVIIPGTTSGYEIKGIEDNAFKGNTNITSIKIPNTIEYIGNNAFEGCSNINDISFYVDETVSYTNYYLRYIGDYAFANCEGIESIDIKGTATTYYDYNFQYPYYNKYGINYGNSLFCGCKKLKNATLPSSTSILSESMFKDCTSLETVETPWHTRIIRKDAFRNCSSISKVTFNSLLESIETGAFVKCTGMKDIYFPEIDNYNVSGFCKIDVGAFTNYCTLHVHSTNRSSFKNNEVWNWFNIVCNVEKIILDKNTYICCVGETIQPKYTLYPEDAIDKDNIVIKWRGNTNIDNLEEICSIDNKTGAITGKKESRITIRGNNGPIDYNTIQASFVDENGKSIYSNNSYIWIVDSSNPIHPTTFVDNNYSCNITDYNKAHLEWYKVEGATGYEIKYAYKNDVVNGKEAWDIAEKEGKLLGNTIVNADKDFLDITSLPYFSSMNFAIRVLSDAGSSEWFGYGNSYESRDRLCMSTDQRYPVPHVLSINNKYNTESGVRLYFKTNINQIDLSYNDDKEELLNSYYEHFHIDEDGKFGYKYLRIKPTIDNPDASIDEKWTNYEITELDKTNGYIDITGLSSNSMYMADVIDPTVESQYDATYNTVLFRTDGKVSEPIILNHEELMTQYGESRADTFSLATSKYHAAPISPILKSFINDVKYSDGQEFWLDGGKTYYLDGQDMTCKGFVIRTNPSDVAKGLRAKVICGIGKNSLIYYGKNGEQWQGSYSMFMLGRYSEDGEDSDIYMKKLAFYDIDFDNPTSLNYGDQVAGAGTPAGNYFFNMYSNGLALTLDSLVIENCTFKRLVRGFIREQGANYKIWNHVLIANNQFFDCGYYNQGAGGYCWIDGASNNEKTNLYADMKVVNNTFYDSPFPAFFNESKRDGSIGTGGPWMITFSNNTLVNFNTRADGSVFKMRYLPDGSVFNVENNLFVLCKQFDDQRKLQMWGADIRSVETLADGATGHITLNFNNNWSTNNNLTNGCIFSARQWTSTSNNFGKLVQDGTATLNGSLYVNIADISATELFISPCPPHIATSASEQNMHRADALDGTASQYNVNLYYNNTEQVLKSEIYTNNVGASIWRSFDKDNPTGITETPVSLLPSKIYNINGIPVTKLNQGINIVKMKDGSTKKIYKK